MSSVVISGDTSGAITLAAPAVAGTNTLTFPALTGTAVVTSSAASAVGQVPFSTDGSTWTPTAKIVSGTSVASTSGTYIDFTGIPSWVKRITVMFSGVSTNGTNSVQIQLGTSSGFVTSGYVAFSTRLASAALATSFITSGVASVNITATTDTLSGLITIANLTSNTWASSGNVYLSSSNGSVTAGSIALSGTLDRVRITTVGGTDTFDAGSINILYE